MHLCEDCKKNYKNSTYVMGSGFCKIKNHGFYGFESLDLIIFCPECAKKSKRCQLCTCFYESKK